LYVDNSNASVQPQGETPSVFSAGSAISLTRDVNGVDIVVDSNIVPGGWFIVDGNSRSIERDISRHKCIRRLWASGAGTPTLGLVNGYNTSGDPNIIQAHPANSDFNNVGQIGMIFRKGAYYKYGTSDANIIGYNGINKEYQVRLNLADPNYQELFKYLMVIDPNDYGNPDTEKRVKGRININTAPWYVISQLPWVSHRRNGYNDPNLAKAIVVYRDATKITGGPDYRTRPNPGIESIGQLCNVVDGSDDYRIDYYSRLAGDQKVYPDLDPNDGAADDFEERDLIFARISDLVTVRSDVFTAYILVRIGVDGPQKRYMAILDRTGVTGPGDKVSVEAFQNVPAAR
jgi:hypothetical protein